MNRIKILGVKIDSVKIEDVLSLVKDWIKKEQKKYIVTPNPEILVLSEEDKEFKKILNKADLAVADGVGLKLAKWNLKRLTGVDLMNGLIKESVKNNWKVFLLGGKIGIADKTKKMLEEKYPRLKIKIESGSQNIENISKKENNELIKKINDFQPNLLFVGLGHGKQEKWIYNNLNKLKVNVSVGIGGAFDYLVNPFLRAPKILQKLGLEWLWRLFMQPWRWKRQLSLIKFLWRVL